ncbi:MAG TPA: GNAT family N-acetyltransferase [Amycolatopsis sp.]|uniref:GNAT family N-acetyltransferase n=1 Tax=Amycolatopsis sp. TaxID=37632 RepID=UPI002F42990A
MNSSKARPAVVITRVSERQWHALDDDRVVGRGEASPRPDGRLFLSIDSWHGEVFDRLAQAMLPGLPKPLYTVVDEADAELTAQWLRAGLTVRRREWEYLVPTDPAVTGLGDVVPPPGVTVGPAVLGPLRELDDALRAEVDWPEMPAEVVARPDGPTAADLPRFTVAAESGRAVGLVRVAPLRRPRLGLVAVRAGRRRRGIGRALLAHVLGGFHDRGIPTASAEVKESNEAALALFDGIGARRAGSALELVVR